MFFRLRTIKTQFSQVPSHIFSKQHNLNRRLNFESFNLELCAVADTGQFGGGDTTSICSEPSASQEPN